MKKQILEQPKPMDGTFPKDKEPKINTFECQEITDQDFNKELTATKLPAQVKVDPEVSLN